MDALKCRLCGERHYGMCADKDPFKRAALTEEQLELLKRPDAEKLLGGEPISAHVPLHRGPKGTIKTPVVIDHGMPPLSNPETDPLPTMIDELKVLLKVVDKQRSRIKAAIRRYNQRMLMRQRRKKAKKKAKG